MLAILAMTDARTDVAIVPLVLLIGYFAVAVVIGPRSGWKGLLIYFGVTLLLVIPLFFLKVGSVQGPVRFGPVKVNDDADVELELNTHERLHGRLLDFGSRRYHVVVGGETREIDEEDVLEIRFQRAARTAPAEERETERLLEARRLLANGYPEDARPLVERETLEHPQSRAARALAVQVAIARKDPQAAIRAYGDLQALTHAQDLALLKGVAIAALERELHDGKDIGDRTLAYQHLRDLEVEATIEPLRKAMPAEGWDDSSAFTLLGLVERGDAAARPIFEDLAASRAAIPKLVGFAGLVRLGEKEKEPAFKAALEDAIPRADMSSTIVIPYAVRASRARADAIAPALAPFLGEPNGLARTTAVLCYAACGTDSPKLRTLAPDPEEAVRMAANIAILQNARDPMERRDARASAPAKSSPSAAASRAPIAASAARILAGSAGAARPSGARAATVVRAAAAGASAGGSARTSVVAPTAIRSPSRTGAARPDSSRRPFKSVPFRLARSSIVTPPAAATARRACRRDARSSRTGASHATSRPMKASPGARA